MTYGITVKYFEESRGKKFFYSQYREYRTLGVRAKHWVNTFDGFFKIHSVVAKDEKNQTIDFNWNNK